MFSLQGVGNLRNIHDVMVAAFGVDGVRVASMFFVETWNVIIELQSLIVGTQAHVCIVIIAIHVMTPMRQWSSFSIAARALYQSIQLM